MAWKTYLVDAGPDPEVWGVFYNELPITVNMKFTTEIITSWVSYSKSGVKSTHRKA